MAPDKPTPDMLRVIDRLLDAHLQQSPITGRALANLAVAMATEYSGAARGLLLLDEGEGLKPTLALGADLRAADLDQEVADGGLVAKVAHSRIVASRSGSIAAPILSGKHLRGVLYLEGSSDRPLPGGEEFAVAVAVKIAAILRNTELTEKISRQHKGLEILERVGARLSAGALGTADFESVLEAAVHATDSSRGLLALPAGSGEIPELLAHGVPHHAVNEMASRLRSRPIQENWRGAVRSQLGDSALCEELRSDPLTTGSSAEAEAPIGFLAVGYPAGGDYGEARRRMFRALASILTGALARRDHFRRATEDPLTGTGSRLALELTFSHLLARAERSGTPFSLVLLDLNRFKEINDAFGHLTGDLALQEVGDLLRSRLRSQDFVGRYGGDEFVLLLPETDSGGAISIARALREKVFGERFTARGLQITLSAGTATFPDHGTTFGSLLQEADRALYATKLQDGEQVRPDAAPE